jgi:glycosyltransferase involved in cell wall biosynthesis
VAELVPDNAAREPRVAVIVTCHEEGSLVLDAVRSVQEPEPVELVVVDDASRGEPMLKTLDKLEAMGVKVLRLEENRGVAHARMTGLAATSAPFVVPLDGDDLAEPGVLSEMADRLEAEPTAVACVGDLLEFGDREVLRAVPDRLDPYRVAYTNEYPITAAFRRSILEEVDGWRRRPTKQQGYEDWGLWMDIAERGWPIAHLGPRRISYRRRLHGRRLNHAAKEHHVEIYRTLRDSHPRLFAELPEHRRQSDLSGLRKLLYPVVYGERARVPFEHLLKPIADRFGIWTLTRR